MQQVGLVGEVVRQRAERDARLGRDAAVAEGADPAGRDHAERCVEDPRTRVGHAFRAGADGMKLLAYGTREPNDIAWYPRSKKVYFRGVGLMTRLPELDYWDGE